MEANIPDARQQGTAENPSTREQHHPLQEGYVQQTVPPGYGVGQPPGMGGYASGHAPGMGPHGPYQAQAHYGPGQPFGTPPSSPGQAPGTAPYIQAHAGYYAWHPAMAGPAYPPPGWVQAPYFVPPGYPSYGPYAGQASAESASEMDGLVRDVMNGNVSPSSLTRLLGLGDTEFWKGALIGAVVVLLLTSDTVKQALFGARGTAADTSTSGSNNI